MKKKSIILSIFIILLASVAVAQPSRPNNVWGEATDSATDNPVPNLDIEAYKSGSSIASTTTDASGDYDFNIPADKASEGDNIDLYVDGSDSEKDITYQIGGVDNVDFAGDYGLKVGLEDASVDEGNNVGLSPTVSNAENPSYTWTFPNDNKGASISGSGSSVQFQAPSNVDSDTDVDVEVQVSNEAGEVASDTATVTIEDTDAEQEDGTGGGGGSGGSIDSNLNDDEDEQDGEEIQGDDNQTEDDETGDSQDD
jgi:predicted secreted protein